MKNWLKKVAGVMALCVFATAMAGCAGPKKETAVDALKKKGNTMALK